MVKPKKNEKRADFLERCIDELYKQEVNTTEAEKQCMLIWKENKKGDL